MKKLSFLFVQDHNRNGGAARAAGRWACLLGRGGHIVMQAAGDEASSAGSLLTGKPPRGWWRVVECFTGQKKERKKKVEQQLGELLAKESPGLIWFHNIAGGRKWGWSEEMISISRQYSPLIWTFHDMWGLGDGEPYWAESEKAERYESSPVRGVVNLKAEHRLVLTAPSQWLAKLASEITGSKCHFLPNPIDLSIYSPGDRQEARGRLGIKSSGLVVLAGADSLKDKRKGMDLLFKAWSEIPKEQAALALFGRNGETTEGKIYLGSIESDAQMADAYRAADLYVHPARQENAPCTIQESLACGTPVLAFAVGGIPEMVVPCKTGFLAARLSSESLAETLASALAAPEQLREMRERCRKHAEEIWKPEKLMRQFAELVRGLMAESQ
jgi:glycosyltransferase involved in cell wall biosynthesis